MPLWRLCDQLQWLRGVLYAWYGFDSVSGAHKATTVSTSENSNAVFSACGASEVEFAAFIIVSDITSH